jgi:hypothetical protein
MLCYFGAGRAVDLGSGADSSREEDDYFSNISFFSFNLQGLFCVSRFAIQKHVFGRLNSHFSVYTFTGSVRDALREVKAGTHEYFRC